jgi:hypothetical protein
MVWVWRGARLVEKEVVSRKMTRFYGERRNGVKGIEAQSLPQADA